MHGAFEAHVNRYGAEGAEVLNLELPFWMEPSAARFEVGNVDGVARLAERDPREAVEFLMESMVGVVEREGDWPDVLARALVSDPHLRLLVGAWAYGGGRG